MIVFSLPQSASLTAQFIVRLPLAIVYQIRCATHRPRQRGPFGVPSMVQLLCKQIKLWHGQGGELCISGTDIGENRRIFTEKYKKN